MHQFCLLNSTSVISVGQEMGFSSPALDIHPVCDTEGWMPISCKFLGEYSVSNFANEPIIIIYSLLHTSLTVNLLC